MLNSVGWAGSTGPPPGAASGLAPAAGWQGGEKPVLDDRIRIAGTRESRSLGGTRVSVPLHSRRAAAALFLERQWLDRPRGRRLTAGSLADFTAAACGVQIDSVNVVERAHLLTLWSRFGEFDRAAFDRLAYRRRVVFEYLTHVACFVDTRDLPLWRAMMDSTPERFRRRYGYPGRQRALVDAVERTVALQGPLGNSAFERPAGQAAGGWWSWKPANHALDYLWKAGRIAVHSRRNFEKLYAPLDRVLPGASAAVPTDASEAARTRVLRSLRAMGAAGMADLARYWTWPRMMNPELRRTVDGLVRDGRVIPVAIEGQRGPWYLLAEDLPSLERAERMRRPSRGTTLLCPFDSLLWHRERVLGLWGFRYRIEIYVPGHKRTHGYYVLPVMHEGRFIGRVDLKLHRERGTLEARSAGFEPWLREGGPGPGAAWGPVDEEGAVHGTAESLWSLARFTGADRVTVGRVTPPGLRAPLARALRQAAP